MLRTAVFALALVAWTGSAVADPFQDFFQYRESPPPQAGDCGAISATIGPAATWYGEFSGRRWDNFTDSYYPYSARGCFDSEIACRIWQQQALTVLDRGPLYYMTCRRGV